jgi:hypothetical protein
LSIADWDCGLRIESAIHNQSEIANQQSTKKSTIPTPNPQS